MNWRRASLCLLAAVLLIGSNRALPGQQAGSVLAADNPAPKPGKTQFFAGLVIEADAGHLKVSRNLVGRAPETHVFAMNAKTKTPKGGVKVKTRVTVRYQHLPEQDLALEIQVRPLSHAQKPS